MKHKTTQNKIQKLLKNNDLETLTNEVRVSLFMQLLGYTVDLQEETLYTDVDGNPSNKMKCYRESKKISKFIPPNYQGVQRYLDKIDNIEDIKEIEDDVPDEHE